MIHISGCFSVKRNEDRNKLFDQREQQKRNMEKAYQTTGWPNRGKAITSTGQNQINDSENRIYTG